MYEVLKAYINSRTTLTEAEHDRIQSFAIIKKLRKRQYLLQQDDVWKYDAFVAIRMFTHLFGR